MNCYDNLIQRKVISNCISPISNICFRVCVCTLRSFQGDNDRKLLDAEDYHLISLSTYTDLSKNQMRLCPSGWHQLFVWFTDYLRYHAPLYTDKRHDKKRRRRSATMSYRREFHRHIYRSQCVAYYSPGYITFDPKKIATECMSR